MGKFLVLDTLTDFFDKDATILAVADYASAQVDISGHTSSDDVCTLGVAIQWPGITSAGAAVVTITVLSDSATPPTTVVYTSRAYTLAEAVSFFGGPDGYILPLANVELDTNIIINIGVSVANITGGTLTAGLVPMPT